jgi:glycosyltransferase involved in cell wall biosynthesis
MRILYYSKTCFGDCDFPLLKAMMEKGHDVTVIYNMTPYSLRTTIFNISKQIPQVGIFKATDYSELKTFEEYMPMDNIYVSNDPTGRFCLKSLWQEFKTFLFIRKQEFDVIHYVEDPSPLFSFLLWFFRKKLVVTIHDGRPHTGDDSKKSQFVRRRLKSYVKRFLLLNKKENKLFEEGYGVNPSYVYNSHLGYYEMLHMFGNKDIKKQNYILFFGRISPYKGIEYLLKAMRRVHEVHPETRVIIAGKGEYNFDIEPYINLGYVEFRNKFIELDELADLIRGAQFTVCPYTEATQSGVVYSSFALNTPVIATRVGGLPEMIDDGKTGVIVPPCDEQSLAEAIIDLLGDYAKLSDLTNNIKVSADSGKGSWTVIADEYLDIYKK